MSLLDTLRKGFGFFLMSFGVSAPKKKPATAASQPPNTQPPSSPNPGN
ncbi:MAG TPA: hypothetical protein VFU55_05025 [Terracidiphilus sp.]|nr:hypothetical protein [Terracidiphilus sp.]